MTDEMPMPELIDVTDRIWGPVRKYLPKDDEGRVKVSNNPEIAVEQVHDGFMRAKKASGTRKFDGFIRNHMPERIVDEAVFNLLGRHTLKKGSHGRLYEVKNYWAAKLGWVKQRTVVKIRELPRVHRRRRII